MSITNDDQKVALKIRIAIGDSSNGAEIVELIFQEKLDLQTAYEMVARGDNPLSVLDEIRALKCSENSLAITRNRYYEIARRMIRRGLKSAEAIRIIQSGQHMGDLEGHFYDCVSEVLANPP